MSNLAHNNANASGRATPRWVVALLMLQTLVLIVALAGNGLSMPAAEASQNRRDPVAERPQEQTNVLPNAADQRQEQIRLLRQIADELGQMNGKLDQLNKHAEAASRPAPR